MSRLNLPDVVVRFMGDSSDLEAAFSKLEKRATSFAGKLSAATLFASISGASVREFASFDDAMTRSLAHANDLAEASSKAMANAARDISRHSLSSSTDLALAYTPLIQAGFSAKGAIEALAIAERHAVATGSTAAVAARELTQALTAQRLIAGDTTQDLLNMARVSDVVTRSTQLANVSARDMAEALGGKLGIAARNLGKDMEELAALHLALAQGGIKGSSAATIEESLFRNLQSAAVKNKDVWQSMGITSVWDESTGKMGKMSDIVSQLSDRFSHMTGEQKMASEIMLGFNARTLLPIMAIEGLAGKINYFEDQLRKASGTTEVFASKILNDFLSQLIQTWHQVKDLAYQIGEMLVPYMKELVGWINNAINWWNSLNPAIRQVIITIGLLVGALLLVGIAFGAIGTVIGIIVAPFMALGAALAAIMSPEVLGVVAAAVALTAAVGGLAYWLYGPEGIEAGWNASLEAAKSFFMGTLGFLVNFKENMGIFGTWLTDNWRSILSNMWELTKTLFVNMGHNLFEFLYAVGDTLGSIYVNYITNWDKLWEGARDQYAPVLKDMYTDFYTVFAGIVKTVALLWGWLFSYLKDFFTGKGSDSLSGMILAGLGAAAMGFIAMIGIIGKAITDLARNPWKYMDSEALQNQIDKVVTAQDSINKGAQIHQTQGQISDEIKNIWVEQGKDMVNPFRSIGTIPLNREWNDMFKMISGIWKGADFVSPFAGFESTVPKLNFNLKIPDWDAAKATDEREKRIAKEGMKAGPMDFDSPLATPGKGPGTEFKELAANRFIIQTSYPLAGMQEQRVRAPVIESKFDKLLDIIQGLKEKGSKTKIGPNQNTPVLDVAPAVFDD